jgi:hypothetical protein
VLLSIAANNANTQCSEWIYANAVPKKIKGLACVKIVQLSNLLNLARNGAGLSLFVLNAI